MYFDRQAWANSVDPDQMPQNVASDQGLYCLPFIEQFLDRPWDSEMDLLNPCHAECSYTLPSQTVQIQISWLL